MKKLVSILLALALIFALSTTAFAEGEETFTLTITGATGHTYDIYQIYTGDVAQEGSTTVLSNVKYGQNHYPINGQAGDAVPGTELENLRTVADPTDVLQAAVKGTPYKENVTPAEGETTINITDIPAGYYMIVDVSPVLTGGQTKSPIMLQVLETVTIASKHASITSEKKVDDKNDSTTDEDEVNWVDSADYDIGDEVPFKLSVTLPSTLDTYESYELTFHDKQAEGFDAPVITAAYILKADGTTKIKIPAAANNASGYTLTNYCTKEDTCEFGGCTFNVKVGDIKGLYGQNEFEDGDQIVIEYKSKLKANAIVGKEGNENGMYVCHPDGHTPEDHVTVLTYQLTVKKIDGASKEALNGAGFTLYKKDAAGNYNPVSVGKDANQNDIYELKGENMTFFTWKGIDGGSYKLVETTTPAGYNTVTPIEFVIDANHKEEWIKGGNAAFLDLIAKDAKGDIVFADAITVENATIEDGILEGNVENYKGVVLPETGARGTFMLISISTMVVLVAVVFMITRKKMSVYED